MSLNMSQQLSQTTSWKKYCSSRSSNSPSQENNKTRKTSKQKNKSGGGGHVTNQGEVTSSRGDRAPLCHRSVYLKTGIVSHSRGSCYLECGHTKVVAAVSGPRENNRSEATVMEGRLVCRVSVAAFSLHNQHIPEKHSAKICSDMEQFVEEAFACVVDLRKFPKSTLELSLLVLENDGGLLGAALTALSCALTSAGIHMYDLLIGATCAAISAPAAHPHVQCGGDQSGRIGNSQTQMSPGAGVFLVDPCFEEEVGGFAGGSTETAFSQCRKNSSVVTVGFLPNIQQIATLNQRGQSVNWEELTQATKLCVDSCQKVHAAVKTFLKQEMTAEHSL